MPEGFTTPGGGTAGPVHNDPNRKPEPDAHGPRGYTWNRHTRAWQAKVKGDILYKVDVLGRSEDELAAEHRANMAQPGAKQGDPEPGWFREDDQPQAAGGRKRQSIEDVPKEVVNDIAGFAGLVGAPLLAMLQQIDPYCGTALANAYEGIVDATLPLICRSEKIVKYFSGDSSDWLLWGKLALALRPVAQAVLSHHVFRTVQVVRDQQGVPHVVPRNQGGSEHGDHLVPEAQPEYHYAA